MGFFCRGSAETPAVPAPSLEAGKGAEAEGPEAVPVEPTDANASEGAADTGTGPEAVDSASVPAPGDAAAGSPVKTTAANFKDIQAESLDTPVKDAMNGQVKQVERNEQKSTRRLSIKVKAPPPPPTGA